MNALVSPTESQPSPRQSTPLLRTLALCDLVDSTSLVERLGDQPAAQLLRRHDRMARDLMLAHEGQEIDKTDGFLVLFERPIQAIAFALAYQRELQHLGADEKVELKARIGIHVGDVLVWQNEPGDVIHGAKPLEVEGLVKPVTARLASLALPGQVLVSGVAASLAQRAHAELGAKADRTRWINHGRYRFKGVPEPQVVYEVGEVGFAPLRQPPYSGKAWREVPWWRRPGTMFIEAGIAAAAIVLGIWLILRPPAAIAFAERDWVVLGDLQNLTGQANLDDTLRTALRLSVEQSRYVNVVSDLQVRDSVRRMRRDPANTRIDRAIGAEVALREGARALVLPSIAEVGGKLRVTAEVIDPGSQTTVYTDSAEGSGIESVLTSLDRINAQLRARLGESLAQVKTTSQPLAKVTTDNLEALRAYSLARKAATEGNGDTALDLYEQAIRLDPEFGLAYLSRAGLRLGADDKRRAKEDIERAKALRERLPAREQLYMDALAASFAKPSDIQKKWALLGEMYPDHYAAFANLAHFIYVYDGRYAEAIRVAEKAIAPNYPRSGNTHYLLGQLYTASEMPQKAKLHLQRAKELNSQRQGTFIVDAAASMRRFAEADAEMAAAKPLGVPSNDVLQHRLRVALAVDKGLWRDALARADEAETAAAAVGPLPTRLFQGTKLSLQAIATPGTEFARQINAYARNEISALSDSQNYDRDQSLFGVFFAAYLAARNGDEELAKSVAAPVVDHADIKHYRYVADMAALAQAQLSITKGDAKAALILLSARIDGAELYLLHSGLRDAHTLAGNLDDAAREAQWLAQHRGRAYAEYNATQILKALNVAESNLAVLSEAEIALLQKKTTISASKLADFLRLWPEAELPAPLKRRVDAVRKDAGDHS
ncbi:MAG: putative peptide modification system cyclase [Rhodanobacteraceae bacterium]|nr:putative peptide modification system cyclase [Rhodanobacteraceae bacterium]